MGLSSEIMDEINKKGIEITDADIAELERQGIEEVDLEGEVSLSDTTARVHIAAMDDPVLQVHLRRSLAFEQLPFDEQETISTSIYFASVKAIPNDKKFLFLQLTKLYEKKFFKSFRYLLASKKTKALAATAYMVSSFN